MARSAGSSPACGSGIGSSCDRTASENEACDGNNENSSGTGFSPATGTRRGFGLISRDRAALLVVPLVAFLGVLRFLERSSSSSSSSSLLPESSSPRLPRLAVDVRPFFLAGGFALRGVGF